jgi:hypothetical protein
MIVATGDHYTLDILAGVLLAGIAYAIGFRLIKPEAPGDAPAAAGARKKKAIAMGCGLFALGIGLGIFTRNGFRSAPEAYEYGAGPRFADIFAREAEFVDNYGVQFYFGSFRLVHGDTKQALGYFEKALPLARGFTERKTTEMRIKECRAKLGLRP